MVLEGTDYYVENGKWVFTAAFLKKRGYCCNSGCRHCPYQERIQMGTYTGKLAPKKASCWAIILNSDGIKHDEKFFRDTANDGTGVERAERWLNTRLEQLNSGQEVPIKQKRVSKEPLEDKIRTKAYLNWEKAGKPDGKEVDFWVEAEKEVFQENPNLVGSFV